MDTINSPRPEQRNRLVRQLVRLANQQDIQLALGIADAASQSEDFWRIQSFTAQNRFHAFCRQQLGLDLAKEVDECSEDECAQLADRAQALFDQGLRYADVRRWFLHRGRLEHTLAYDARREQERLQSTSLRVLLVLQPKGAKWLKAAADGLSFELTDKLEDAMHIPVRSVAQLEKDYLAQLSKDFEFAKSIFDAKEVKVLCGPRPA